jgi:hypothetical protein
MNGIVSQKLRQKSGFGQYLHNFTKGTLNLGIYGAVHQASLPTFNRNKSKITYSIFEAR